MVGGLCQVSPLPSVVSLDKKFCSTLSVFAQVHKQIPANNQGNQLHVTEWGVLGGGVGEYMYM